LVFSLSFNLPLLIHIDYIIYISQNFHQASLGKCVCEREEVLLTKDSMRENKFLRAMSSLVKHDFNSDIN